MSTRSRSSTVARFVVAGLLALYLATLLALLFAPGRLLVVGPLVCPGAQHDTFVVWEAGGGSRSRGTGAEEAPVGPSLFCMGERGDTTEMGTLRPALYLLGAETAALAFLVLVGWMVRRRFARRRRRRQLASSPPERPEPSRLP